MLLMIGSYDRERVRTFRRTSAFSPADFDLLRKTLAQYRGVVTTPPILTEVSNLMGDAFHAQIAPTIVGICTDFHEHAPRMEQVFAQRNFNRLGFADASVLTAAGEDVVVLTDDVQLYLAVLDTGHDALNFAHLRQHGA